MAASVRRPADVLYPTCPRRKWGHTKPCDDDSLQINGELIVWEPDRGRTSFVQLQRRLTAGAGLPRLARDYPATFDLLPDSAGVSLLSSPLAEWRGRLATPARRHATPLTLCPQTASGEEAAEWLTSWSAAGIEGLLWPWFVVDR